MFDRIFPPKQIPLPSGKIVLEKHSRTPIILLLVCLGIYFALQLTQFNLSQLLERWDQFFVIVADMLPPRWSHISTIWQPLLDTIKMSLLGSFIGALVALPIAYAASTNIVKQPVITGLARVFLSLLRTLPSLVTALIATFIFGLGTFAGTIAICLFTLSYVGKLLYEQIENADMGAYEAMESLGMTKGQAFRQAIFPQILPNYLSTSLFCFEGNVRYAAILGYVGAGGIGLLLNEGLGWRDYAGVGMILLVLAITVLLIESVSEHFRKKLL
ncbi:phosphonate transport system permease protein [Amphibacillus marinus]|uniref:Phosphonate transport system permease protein n=1 Tax=Amphibacillus marinus TaxID=872970 RepID=A0A1H8LKX0_9BACI|nr:phosphonate ABC transporter, permease protein PhnE [Amphibacillus marinus]SEO05719.1 phosphonate transport system permease protein [Amphibacillus marinus]